MASATVTVSAVQKSGGKVYLTFSDGSQLEFASLAEAQSYSAAPFQNPTWAKQLGIARYLAVDPTASNPALIVGKSVTITDQSNTMVTVA